MKRQQKTPVFLRLSLYDHDILWNFVHGLFFWWGFWKKISSGVSTFQRIRDVEFTRKNRHVSTSRLPKVKHHCGVVHPVFFLKITKPCSPFWEATKTNNPFADWKSLVRLPIFEGVSPPPHTEEKIFDLLCFLFFSEGFQISTLSKIG